MYHILVVDDSVVNLKMAKFILEKDYKVSCLKSGTAALSLLRHVDADLILMDVEMQDMDGVQTVREINKEHPNKRIPVIFLTAHSEKDTLMRCLSVGLSDYIVKPYDPESLLEKVATAIRKNEDLMQLEKEDDDDDDDWD